MNKIIPDVTSEIGRLKKVLLHRPGTELEKLTPDLLATLLFDDIPWLREVQKEHDEFADILRGRGVDVYYVDKMLKDVLEDAAIKRAFVDDVLEITHIGNDAVNEKLREFLNAQSAEDLTVIAISGMLKTELRSDDIEHNLWNYINADWPLYIDPVPNLYFMRDPAAFVGGGLSINRMHTAARRREPLLIKYIYMNHPAFSEAEKLLWNDYKGDGSIEGGDILVLSEEVVAIGCSERTTSSVIEDIAAKLFKGPGKFKEVLAIGIPPVRSFMHLDTVFTMIDRDKFTVYPGIAYDTRVYSLTQKADGGIKVEAKDDLEKALKHSLGLPAVQLIASGGGDAFTAAREQWNDSTNTLAIEPGVVVTYSRNEKTNETLVKSGVEVLSIGGSELARGRGGPRCMSCPMERERL
jgi:arginine deiminase